MSRITQKGATGPLALQANGAFQTSTDADLVTLVGSRWDLSDGREVILVKAAAATTVASGKLYQDAAVIGDHQNCAVTAFTAYSNNGNIPAKVTLTLAGTAVTANQYRGGFLIVNDNNGEGQTLRIASHPAADASASLAVTLEDAPNTAITTASEVSLHAAHGQDVIISPTTATAASVGVALSPISASSYGFLVTKGLVACLSDATAPANGAPITPSVATAGAIGQPGYAANVVTTAVIGTSAATAVSTEYRAVFLNI